MNIEYTNPEQCISTQAPGLAIYGNWKERKILKHVGLWEVKSRPLPKTYSPPGDFYTDNSDSQTPPWDDDQNSGSLTHILCLPFAL